MTSKQVAILNLVTVMQSKYINQSKELKLYAIVGATNQMIESKK